MMERKQNKCLSLSQSFFWQMMNDQVEWNEFNLEPVIFKFCAFWWKLDWSNVQKIGGLLVDKNWI